MPKQYCTPTLGVCPYCRSQAIHIEVPSVRQGRKTVQCPQCMKISTIMPTGKRYPHDDPSDVESPISRAIWLEI